MSCHLYCQYNVEQKNSPLLHKLYWQFISIIGVYLVGERGRRRIERGQWRGGKRIKLIILMFYDVWYIRKKRDV